MVKVVDDFHVLAELDERLSFHSCRISARTIIDPLGKNSIAGRGAVGPYTSAALTKVRRTVPSEGAVRVHWDNEYSASPTWAFVAASFAAARAMSNFGS